jgi:hypothetical protein
VAFLSEVQVCYYASPMAYVYKSPSQVYSVRSVGGLATAVVVTVTITIVAHLLSVRTIVFLFVALWGL